MKKLSHRFFKFKMADLSTIADVQANSLTDVQTVSYRNFIVFPVYPILLIDQHRIWFMGQPTVYHHGYPANGWHNNWLWVVKLSDRESRMILEDLDPDDQSYKI